MKKFLATHLPILLWFLHGGGFVPSLVASEAPPLQLNAVAPVCGDGVFLSQVFSSTNQLPVVKLCDAPEFGKNLVLTRQQIGDLLAANAPDLATNFSGADSIRISRRARSFGEPEMLALLTATLQRDVVKDKGELELNFEQPWTAQNLPDEPLTLRILELPTAGVTPSFIVRFEVHTAHETVGTFQTSVQAHVWRDVWFAHTAINRGELTDTADIARERRDVLNIREALANFSINDPAFEFAESVTAGTPLLARVLKPKAVIHRGQTTNAVLEDGALSITVKVTALEDGAPGQMIHFRNPTSARSLTGKVLNEQTILISL